MKLRRYVKASLHKVKQWLDEGEKHLPPPVEPQSVPFDNSYQWLNASFATLMGDPVCASRPQYVWGMLQGAALAKVLGDERVSMIEFGVASGAGLIAMERIADRCEKMARIGIELFGFDTGTGFGNVSDYRDMPYKFREGYYPCDREELQKRLCRASMKYGLVSETVAAFIASDIPRVAFVGFDLSLYTSTRDALRLFGGDHRTLLPRTPCSFRSAIGKDRCEYTGELLAISEFNSLYEMRKLCRIPGMSYFVPAKFNGHWTQMLYSMHTFDHPFYNSRDAYMQSAVIDIEGKEVFVAARPGADLRSARSRVQEQSQ
jgi:hypothetical protein